MIDVVTEDDASAIADIYNTYIANSIITFEIDPVTPDEMAERIRKTTASYPWVVYRENDEVVGYACLTRFRERAAYRHVAESSIYLVQDVQGKGFGKALYQYLIWLAPDYGIREIIGVIALPNDVSEKLHESLGFVRNGIVERAGFKFGNYIDTAYWQLQVETQE